MVELMKALLDIVFPQSCLVCGGLPSRTRVCAACEADLRARAIASPLCTVCGTPFVPGNGSPDHSCGSCIKDPPPFAAARSAFAYEGRVMEALHRFKYSGEVNLARPLAQMASICVIQRPSLVIPVPLHPGRLKERGFNQSLLLARELSRLTGAPLDYSTLKRTRDTGQQVGLDRDERRRNVRGAFALAGRASLAGADVLLVDDVYTTGATIAECASVLKRAGATVRALTLARALKP